MRIKFSSLIFLFLLFSCTQNFAVKQQIKNFETSSNCLISEFILIEDFQAFYYKDSAIILQKEYESFYYQKMSSLELELNNINARITKTEKAQNDSENPSMKRAIAYKLHELQSLKKQQNKIINTYKLQPELTQFNNYKNVIANYKSNPEKLIGYTLKASFNAHQGDLPEAYFQNQYLIDSSKGLVLARISQIQISLQ